MTSTQRMRCDLAVVLGAGPGRSSSAGNVSVFPGAVASFLDFDVDAGGRINDSSDRSSLRWSAFVVCVAAEPGNSIIVSRGVGAPKSLSIYSHA